MVSESGRLPVIDGDGLHGDALPHNIAAEQVVLGAVMLSPAALAEVRQIIDADAFYRSAHQVIWGAITAQTDRGDPHDPLAVGAALGRELAKAGGAPYLHTLIAAVPTAANAAYYATMVKDLAYARRVIETSTRLAQAAWNASGDAAGLRGTVAAETAALATAEARGWADPVPLSAAPDVPAFPLWTLPEWLGEYAASLAEVTQTPPDLAGCLALAVLAVATSGKVWVQAPAWSKPTCLYIAVVLPPGNRKSEVFRAMTGPLRAAEKTLTEAAKPAIAEATIRRKIAEARRVGRAQRRCAAPHLSQVPCGARRTRQTADCRSATRRRRHLGRRGGRGRPRPTWAVNSRRQSLSGLGRSSCPSRPPTAKLPASMQGNQGPATEPG